MKEQKTKPTQETTEINEQAAIEILQKSRQLKVNAFLKEYDELCQKHGFHIEIAIKSAYSLSPNRYLNRSCA